MRIRSQNGQKIILVLQAIQKLVSYLAILQLITFRSIMFLCIFLRTGVQSPVYSDGNHGLVHPRILPCPPCIYQDESQGYGLWLPSFKIGFGLAIAQGASIYFPLAFPGLFLLHNDLGDFPTPQEPSASVVWQRHHLLPFLLVKTLIPSCDPYLFHVPLTWVRPACASVSWYLCCPYVKDS